MILVPFGIWVITFGMLDLSDKELVRQCPVWASRMFFAVDDLKCVELGKAILNRTKKTQ